MIRGNVKKYMIELLRTKGQIKNVRQLATAQESDIIIPSPYANVVIPKTTIDQFVFGNVSKWFKKTALVIFYNIEMLSFLILLI